MLLLLKTYQSEEIENHAPKLNSSIPLDHKTYFYHSNIRYITQL